MKEEEPNSGGWFPRWEEQLPSPEELTPLSQTLITPDLAAAFDIPGHAPPRPPPRPEFEASEVVGGGGSDEQARTLKRPRLVWTPQLHKRFVDAVAQLGIKNAVPKTIMQLMSVDGLTRENVASHLQKYRLYLKRMQGISSAASAHHHHHHHHDAATDHLFASGPLLRPPPPDPFPPFSPIAALHHHYYHQRTMTHLVPGPDHPLRPLPLSPAAGPDDCSPGRSGERKVLTLFPTND